MAGAVQGLQGDVRFLEAAGHGPVHQIEVHVIGPQQVQAPVKGLRLGTPAGILVPQFGGKENLASGDTRVPDRPADAFLVSVRGGRIDVPIARFQRPQYRPFGFTPVFRPKHPQSE